MRKLIIIMSFISLSGYGQELSSSELELYKLMNEYRVKNHLHELPLNDKLCEVAMLHLKNIDKNYKKPWFKNVNLHSWFKDSRWKAQVFKSGEIVPTCGKPSEINGYDGRGYEIYYWDSRGIVVPKEAIKGWAHSNGHNNIMVNKGQFKTDRWTCVGLAIYKGHSCIWFGDDTK